MRIVCKGKLSGSNLLEIFQMDITVCIESQQCEILRRSRGGVNYLFYILKCITEITNVLYFSLL